MTIKELIEREQNNNKALANLIKRTSNKMTEVKNIETLYNYEKHMLHGIFHTLTVLEIIDLNEFYQLLDDIDNY